MNSSLLSYFKVADKETRIMPFGKKSAFTFNYVDFTDPKGVFLQNTVALRKQMNNSFELEIGIDGDYKETIKELKLTNQNILTWEDYWIDKKTKGLIDPGIEKINLQRNKLTHANFNLSRQTLKEINLEGNDNLRAIFISNSPRLKVLNLSNCPAIDVINLGNNRSIKAILAKNCNLSGYAQEVLLRDFTPIITSSGNRSFSMFRKTYETILDLRGSEVDWGNRRIASKIRLLLCNNWLVLWDNAPPTSIVPPQMYSFFTNNLSDSLIKEYYG